MYSIISTQITVTESNFNPLILVLKVKGSKIRIKCRWKLIILGFIMTHNYAVHMMTMTSFGNKFLWSCCRRHLVGKLNRPFARPCSVLGISWGHFIDVWRLKFVNISLSISVWQSSAKYYLPITIHTTVPQLQHGDHWFYYRERESNLVKSHAPCVIYRFTSVGEQ